MEKLRVQWVPAVISCTLAALFYVYDYFIQVAPSVMTNQLMESFSINAAGLGILGASFFYSYTLMQLPAGLLLDRFGPRKVLTTAVFFSAVGVTLFAITNYFFVAAFSRFLIGIGSSCAFISAVFLVARWFPHHYFALLAGIIQLSGCIGSIFGEAPLALVINHYGWRGVMLVIGIITFILVFVYGFLIRDKAAIHEPRPKKWQVLSNEWQRLRYLFHTSQVWWVGLLGLACWVPVGIIGALWGVPYLMTVYGWDNVIAGKVCSLFWVGLGIWSPLLGWYSNRFATRKKPLVFCFVCALFSATLILFAASLPSWVIILALFLLGGSAAVQSLSFGVIKDFVPPNVFGTASGFINMTAILGSGVSQTLVGFLLQSRWDGARANGIPLYSVSAYRFAFILLIVAATLGLVVSILKLQETHGKQVN